jgi:hypothetical protein
MICLFGLLVRSPQAKYPAAKIAEPASSCDEENGIVPLIDQPAMLKRRIVSRYIKGTNRIPGCSSIYDAETRMLDENQSNG